MGQVNICPKGPTRTIGPAKQSVPKWEATHSITRATQRRPNESAAHPAKRQPGSLVKRRSNSPIKYRSDIFWYSDKLFCHQNYGTLHIIGKIFKRDFEWYIICAILMRNKKDMSIQSSVHRRTSVRQVDKLPVQV